MSVNPSKALAAAARFFVRVGQAGRAAKVYDEYTLPLFPLVLLMDAEGLLAHQAKRQLLQRMPAGPLRPVVDDTAYLHRCEALIKAAARELAA